MRYIRAFAPGHIYLRLLYEQGQIQEFALGGGDVSSPLYSSPFPSPPLSSLTLRSRVPLNRLRGLGERCKLPERGPGRAPAENEFGAL